MENKELFIITEDKFIADKMINFGFDLIQNNVKGFYTFINNANNKKQVVFSEEEKKKIKYSNLLCM